MQKIYPRTNPASFEAPENSNAKPVTQVKDALREFARQDAAQGLKPGNTTQVVQDVIRSFSGSRASRYPRCRT